MTFTPVEDDGGNTITQYNVYMDDGNDGSFSTGPHVISDASNLIFDTTTASFSITAGLTYRFKYSATNSEGEGALSPELSVLVAEAPDAVASFSRTDESDLSAGSIRVAWTIPADDGGSTVRGYKLYIDDVLTYDGSDDASVTAYMITGLTVGQSYEFDVSAVNDFGEGSKTTITLVAAAPPTRLSSPFWSASTTTTITIAWDETSFDGGDSVTSYLVRRDDGPLTDWEAAVSHTDLNNLNYQFTGLSSATLKYRF